MRFHGSSIVSEEDQGYSIPPPPPPADDWSTYTAPPSVAVDYQYHPDPPPQPIAVATGGSGSSGGGWLSSLTSIFSSVAQGTANVSSLVNIHGQPVTPAYHPAPPATGLPVWVVPVAVALGGIALLVVLKKSRKSPAVAGYRRSRRSRK